MLDGDVQCLVPAVLVLRGRRLDRGPHCPSKGHLALPAPDRLDNQMRFASLDGFATQEHHDERRRPITKVDVLRADPGVDSGWSPNEQ